MNRPYKFNLYSTQAGTAMFTVFTFLLLIGKVCEAALSLGNREFIMPN